MGDQSSCCTDTISKQNFCLAGTYEKTCENAYVTYMWNILNFYLDIFLKMSEEFVHFAKKLWK